MNNTKTSCCYIAIAVSVLLFSCTSANITGYYKKNRKVLDRIEQNFNKQYKHRAFSLLYTNLSFKNISVEIVTDSIKYIYEFALGEQRLNDTLLKYHLPVAEIQELMDDMKSVRCAWISNLDYYVDEQKYSLVYMSIKSTGSSLPFIGKKYYILTYFSQPQYYDAEGRLLDHQKRKRLRKINNEIFRRINNRVCYTVSNIFR
jgi:hypothetical protein